MISYYIKRINPKDIFDIVRNPCAKQKKFKLTETKINKFCEYTKNCKYNCYKCHLCDELIRSDINE